MRYVYERKPERDAKVLIHHFSIKVRSIRITFSIAIMIAIKILKSKLD